jgi:tRNA(Ile)-lysidine synthase
MTATRDLLTDPLAARVAACLKRHIQPGARLSVGYSGGLDSSVLLHLLAGLRQSAGFTLSAVHIHHGLSPQADVWAQHCARVCHALDVPLQTHRVEVLPAGEGLEAAARAARYRVFEQADTDFLVLAHHQDDQAETVLLQLLRGASLKGLAAMPEVRPLAGKRHLLRPLLAATRAEISAWATRHALSWIEDESNTDVRLARNALRRDVLPRLTEHFSGTTKALVQAASRFAEAASLLDALADLDGRDALSADGLALPMLSALPEPRARNLLRHFLALSGVEIHQEALHEALRQLLTARPDAQVLVNFGSCCLRRHQQWAVLEHIKCKAEKRSAFRHDPGSFGGRRFASAESLPLQRHYKSGVPPAGIPPYVVAWHGETCIDLGDAGCLLFQATTGEGVSLMPGNVSIRFRAGGEQLRPGAGRPRRTLKNLLREAGIPAWQRESLPLVYVDETLVWAARVGADSDFLVKPGEPGWLISWQPAWQPNKAA